MLKNYFKIAIRNLLKNKIYSFINIGGLAVGMTVTILIGLWVWDEVNYNRSFPNYEHIAQVRNRYTEPLEQKTKSSNSLPQPIAKLLKTKYGHLFKCVTLIPWASDFSIKIGEKEFTKTGQFIENGAIDMFSLKMLYGSKESLRDIQSVIISVSTAKALFGKKNPVNQVIKLNNQITAKITGIYEDLPHNCVFGTVHFFANWENMKAHNTGFKNNENNWNNSSLRIYVQTADNVSIKQASDAINQLYLKDSPSNFIELAKKYKGELWLYPIKDWHLYSEFKDGYPLGGRITFVWLFACIGGFVLFLACINFMNLSTARSEKRAKEVGIRKVIGSAKIQLIRQFFTESLVVAMIAFCLSLILVEVCLPFFNEMADKKMTILWLNPLFWFFGISFSLFTGLIAGSYPALYLSSFQPVKVLKGTFNTGRSGSIPRKTLVVIQFTVSVVLIIGTSIVFQQIQYAQSRPIGYNQESLVRVSMKDPNFKNNKEIIKQELIASGTVKDIAFSSMPVTAIWDNMGGFSWKGKNPDSESSFSVSWVSVNFGKTIQWKIRQGRDFSKDFSTDSAKVIINQSAAKYLGFENPVGEFIKEEQSGKSRQIIGVIDDIVADSPYEPVKMGFYWLEKNPNNLSEMQMRINAHLPMNEALAKIEAIQKKYVPSAAFIYNFVDEEYAKKFAAEQRIGKLAGVFATLAILISCLGLFGLASFMAEKRAKEIGIRKVLGASIFNLWQLLSKDFVILVLISCFISIPIAYYFLNEWLKNYTYRTEISWWIFAASGLGALLITLFTVTYQAIKAALANPVEVLKTE